MKRILIVDDNSSNLEMLGMVFKEEGFDTLLLNGPGDIEKVLSAFSPNVLLMDIMMGSKNGADICRQIKGSPKFASVKILLMTASNAFNKLDLNTTRADGHISKPFDINEVIALVNNLLQN